MLLVKEGVGLGLASELSDSDVHSFRGRLLASIMFPTDKPPTFTIS